MLVGALLAGGLVCKFRALGLAVALCRLGRGVRCFVVTSGCYWVRSLLRALLLALLDRLLIRRRLWIICVLVLCLSWL